MKWLSVDYLSANVPRAFIAAAVLAAVLATVAVYAVARGRTGRPVARALATAAVAAVLMLTLPPVGSAPHTSVTCETSLDPVRRILFAEGWLNVALFVPVGLFGALAVRRPLAVVVSGTVLSALIETVQALLPRLGRGCDSGDLVMNTLGAALGAVAAAVCWYAADRAGRVRRARRVAERTPGGCGGEPAAGADGP
ncbi:VanZ family protein [Streptomyces sp. NPDC006798]|uniref:VanZ family protein n=1 Tax=Streptomyces sp. NPDC006798 TaxID=3155462 RepID=UPI0033DCCD72